MLARRTLMAGGAALLTGLAARSGAADAPSAADLAGDIAILRAALALHPGLHRYNSPATIAAGLDRLRRDFIASTGLDQRYLLLSRFLAGIRCGHSYCNFYNQKRPVAAALFDRPTRLPFRFVWRDDAMIVTGRGGESLPPGTAILAIDGLPPRRLRDRLLPHVRVDGHNDAKRLSLLEVRGDDSFETFDIFQGLLAPPAGGSFRLRIRRPGGRVETIHRPAIGLAARRAMMPAAPESDGPLWGWTLRPDGVALLTMPGWGLYNSSWRWQPWLEERLDSLAGARGLIVDLRDNEGGLDCGDPILARLIDRPWTPPAAEQRLRFQRTPAALDPYLDTWDDGFRTLGVGAAPLPGGFFARPGGAEVLTIAPAARRLAVPVVALTSAVNSSATFQFAARLRALGGRLVGGATGGNRRGINGGAFFFVRLPASGIEFDLPLIGYFPLTPQPDAGLLPDIAVAATAADIAAGRDPVRDRAIALLTGAPGAR